MISKLGSIDMLSLILLVIGGLNWGLVGLFNFNLVAAIFGDTSIISKAVYGLVGLSAVYTLSILYRLYCPRS